MTTTTTTRLLLLGSTGSIGRQTLDVIEGLNASCDHGRSRRRLEVVGLAAGRSADAVLAQAQRFNVPNVAIASPDARIDVPPGVTIRRGPDAAVELVQSVEADIVLGAMVGVAGLPATLEALALGRDVALANKETLVAAGALVVPAARRALINHTGGRLLPVDSEHSAIWQCLPQGVCPPCALGDEVSRIILTASGGPFRTRTKREIYNATRDEALAHPTWSMGPKVTIDSASMTNKALEIIEAHWLFGVGADRIDVVVHPQSIVHSFVEYADGSTLAQLGAPDMRTPIQYALTFPERPPGRAPSINWTQATQLDFEPADFDRFPALLAAHKVIEMGGVAGAVFNAANERAVEAFLAGEIPFGAITELTIGALDSLLGDSRQSSVRSLDDVLEADAQARRCVESTVPC